MVLNTEPSPTGSEGKAYLDLFGVQRRGEKFPVEKKRVNVVAAAIHQFPSAPNVPELRKVEGSAHMISIESFCCPSFGILYTVRKSRRRRQGA